MNYWNDKLREQIEKENGKVICKKCHGYGYVIEIWLGRELSDICSKRNGTGMVRKGN